MTTNSHTSASYGHSASIVEQFLDAVQRRNIEGVSALLASQTSLVQPFTFSGLSASEAMFRFPNKETVLGYFQGVFQNFAQVSFIEREMSVTNDGHTVFVEALGDLRTAVDDLLYSNRYVFRFDLDRDHIISIKEYANPVTASPILGIPLGVNN